MDAQPVLRLLANGDEASFGDILSTATAIAGLPSHLSDLARSDLFDDLLTLLVTRVHRFNKLLRVLEARVTDKDRFSHHITPFLQKLVSDTADLMSQKEFHEILCAALPLCRTNKSRWKLLKEVAACGQTLELLTVSTEGRSLLMSWVLTFNEDGVDITTLEDWTERLVTLIESCSAAHGVSATMVRWRKIVNLKQALQRAIEADRETTWTSVHAHNSKACPKDDVIGHDTLQLFTEFGLTAPHSQRMYRNHLGVLSLRETLPILREVLASYPCKMCQYSLLHQAHPQLRNAVSEIVNEICAHDSLFSSTEGIGEWQVDLSFRALRNLHTFESELQTRSDLTSQLVDLATGNAKSKRLGFKGSPPRIPLQVSDWRSGTFCLWQVDIAPGPKSGFEQQVIKVWTIGSWENFKSMLSEIKQYQNTLPSSRALRSLEEVPNLTGGRKPQIYNRQGIDQDLQPHTGLDIRLVDKDFLDTFNKSFTVTKGLLESMVQRDPLAEFPFNISHTELQIIEHSVTPTLIMGRSGTGKTTCLIFKMVAKCIANWKATPERRVRQVLLTRSETLAEKLRTYLGKLITTLSKTAIVPRLPEMGHGREKLSLFDLDDSNFPLVCTYSEFVMMVENAMNVLDRGTFSDTSSGFARKMVDLKAFRSRYWPRFPVDLTRKVSPNLVFSEIMGTVKGSVHTCKTLNFLQAGEYQNLSARVAPNITSSDDRIKVFRAFELYEQLKHKESEVDDVDWVVRLLRQLRSDDNTRVLLASCLHEIYVDEVQDLRSVDIALLLALGHDPQGFHFGGDTAQGISHDSTFRFQDVKALFYDHFKQQSAAGGQEYFGQPTMFTLTRNYRSHQGILSLASSVMELLWRSFPNIIDKVEPEVGTLVGPAPILFLGCDASNLIGRAGGASASPQLELAFGAEQVIVTRDDEAKEKLVHDLGDAALVLTILQAKGMEFDDVILCDFFSTTPDLVGWRSLSSSEKAGSLTFDSVKHAALCSELKHLYVAITRSRVRFLMIERLKEAAQPFVELMTKKSAPRLVDVTSAVSEDFGDKAKELQPRSSYDPQRWCANGEVMMAQGLYGEAGLCFRRANEPLKEKKATARLKESQGEELEAKNRTRDALNAWETALMLFQGLGSIQDIARVLARLGRTKEAAELLFEHGLCEQAAVLFEKASNYVRASDAWHCSHRFDRAATSLRHGSLYSQMVVYLVENKGRLNNQESLRHQLVVKLLLKQKKIPENERSLAIGLLGSIDEQETFYKDYDMVESLLELYEQQQAGLKLFKLLIRHDRLERALNVSSILPCRGKSAVDEGQLSRLTSTVWVDHINLGSSDHPTFSNEGEGNGYWQQAFRILRAWTYPDSQIQILSLENGLVVKAFLCLYITIHIEKVVSASKLDEIPFEIVFQALEFAKSQSREPDGVIGEAVLLLAGVSCGFNESDRYTLRTWSPLQKIPEIATYAISLPAAAMRWVLDQLSQAVLRVHELSKGLHRDKWPVRCSLYVVAGYCGLRHQSVGCRNLHKNVTSPVYANVLGDLLMVARMLCATTFLYVRGLMSESVSKSFPGARRSWLEKLTAALSFLSGYEQDALVASDIFLTICKEPSFRTVASSLEDLLLYRARKEWSLQVSLGYVLEQVELAAYLGENMKTSLIRRTRERLRHEHPSVHAPMVLLGKLEAHMNADDPAVYHDTLKTYLQGYQRIYGSKWKDLENFHCHTSIFESNAFFLLLQLSQTAIMVPRSWLDLHLSRILSRNALTKRPTLDERYTYRSALVLLLKSFVGLLRWLDEPLRDGNKFVLGGRQYPTRILQQRNCELLAIILVNLLAIPVLCPSDIKSLSQAVLQIFELPTVKVNHLKHIPGNIADLESKLLASHERYQAKNPLFVVNVMDVQTHHFLPFHKSHDIASESLANLRTRLMTSEPTDKVQTPSDNEDAEQVAKENKAALCIQGYWQRYSPRLRARRDFANTEQGRTIGKLQSLSNGASFKIRYILLDLGIPCLLQLGTLSSSVLDLKKRTFNLLDIASSDDSETLDTVLDALAKLEESIKTHHEQLSDEALGALVKTKDEGELRALLQGELQQMAEEANTVSDLGKTLDGVLKDDS